jgi:hypothetical protein
MRPVGVELFHADRRHCKQTATFRHCFANAPKTWHMAPIGKQYKNLLNLKGKRLLV